MYWSRAVVRGDLVEGNVYLHANHRLAVSAPDLEMFVEPADAAILFGFRALAEGDPFEASVPVWMATLRRRAEASDDAIVESVQRIYTQLVDAGSLAQLMIGLCGHASGLGYRKLSFAGALLKDPLMPPALKLVADHLGRPVEVVPTTGMFSFSLGPAPASA